MTVAHQAPLFMGFSRQENWSGLPFPSPGDLPNPGTEPVSPALAGGFFTTEPPGKPIYMLYMYNWIALHYTWSILSSCLFNFYAEYIMSNAGLGEAQAGIKIAGRNFKNLRYADDTTLMAESEEELKSLLMKVKVESEKVGLKLNI